MTRRRELAIVWALVVGHLLLALTYSVINPLGEAPDEAKRGLGELHNLLSLADTIVAACQVESGDLSAMVQVSAAP